MGVSDTELIFVFINSVMDKPRQIWIFKYVIFGNLPNYWSHGIFQQLAALLSSSDVMSEALQTHSSTLTRTDSRKNWKINTNYSHIYMRAEACGGHIHQALLDSKINDLHLIRFPQAIKPQFVNSRVICLVVRLSEWETPHANVR